VWNVNHSIFHKTAFLNSTCMDIFSCCINRFNKLEMSSFASVARSIWMRRNRQVFEGSVDHPNKVYSDAIQLVDDFLKCNMSEEGSISVRMPLEPLLPS
jgi:hypothetical protein